MQTLPTHTSNTRNIRNEKNKLKIGEKNAKKNILYLKALLTNEHKNPSFVIITFKSSRITVKCNG